MSKARGSWLEALLERQIIAHKLPPAAREFVFARPRKWRFDFCWLDQGIALEVEGGIFVRGRHSRGAGFRQDVEKLNTAICLGWRVLRVTDREVKNGEAIRWIQRAMKSPTRPSTVFLDTESEQTEVSGHPNAGDGATITLGADSGLESPRRDTNT